MFDLPPIVIMPPASSAIAELDIESTSLDRTRSRDIWSEFLSLKISVNTQKAYAKAIADFYQRIYGELVSPDAIARFLTLPRSEALFQVLNYRKMLIEAKLAPSTINVRLSALKSLVDYARKMGECNFGLEDIPGLKTETYRDTTGIDVLSFKKAIDTVDRDTVSGARDYAILRLLWDNALRRGEVCSLDVGDFSASDRKLMILGKGKISKSSIDLSDGSTATISHWLELRGSYSDDDPMFASLSFNKPGHRLSGSAVYAIVKQYCQTKTSDKRMSPHRVRHSALTAHLNASDGNIRAAQALSRHADLKTLTLYDDNRHQHQKGATDLLGSLLDD
jgi:integrase/recombinase XerC